MNHLSFISSYFSLKINVFYTLSVSVRQKLIALIFFEILKNSLEISIVTKFPRLILRGWRARTHQIFYMCSRNVLKYSDLIFYVATIKNNKFNVDLRFWQKYHPISEACRRTRAGCAPNFFQKSSQK